MSFSGGRTGVLNRLISKAPGELHLPGYQFCGPGTRLQERLPRGDQGINELDRACLEHDVAYENPDLDTRHAADRILRGKAWARVKSKDAGLSERVWALLTAAAMAGKLAIGAGHRKRKGAGIKKRKTTRKRKTTTKRKKTRQLPIAKRVGGILPVILGVLGALGGLASGAASVTTAVKNAQHKEKLLQEQ